MIITSYGGETLRKKQPRIVLFPVSSSYGSTWTFKIDQRELSNHHHQ